MRIGAARVPGKGTDAARAPGQGRSRAATECAPARPQCAREYKRSASAKCRAAPQRRARTRSGGVGGRARAGASAPALTASADSMGWKAGCVVVAQQCCGDATRGERGRVGARRCLWMLTIERFGRGHSAGSRSCSSRRPRSASSRTGSCDCSGLGGDSPR